MNILGLVAIAVSILAFSVFQQRLRSRPVSVRIALLCVFTVLSIPAVLFATHYLHVFPEREWFYWLRSWAGTEFLVVFLGCEVGAAASLLPRWLLVLPLTGLIALAAVPYIKPIIGPIPDNVFQEHWRGDICLQSTSSTCGPASVCTILKQLGTSTTERAVSRAAFSYGGGTEAWYLARYVRSRGYHPRFDFRRTFSPVAGQPALIGVLLGGAGHFIAVLEIKDDQVRFADPLHGEERLPLQDFLRRYQFTGFHMIVDDVGV
jgi:Peptidase C39 family